MNHEWDGEQEESRVLLEWVKLGWVKGRADASFTHCLPSTPGWGFHTTFPCSLHMWRLPSPLWEKHIPPSPWWFTSELTISPCLLSITSLVWISWKLFLYSFRDPAWPELYDWHHMTEKLMPFSVLQFVCILQQEILSPNSTLSFAHFKLISWPFLQAESGPFI